MNSIIIYATKYGCAEKSAKILASKMGGQVDLVNIMKEDVPSLDKYDNIIFGGSVYMGKAQKKLTDYTKANLQFLLNKKIGLFVCAGNPDIKMREKELEDSFPNELFTHAIIKEIFGYEIHYEKLSFIDKIIVRLMKGSSKNILELSEEKIENFAKVMSN